MFEWLAARDPLLVFVLLFFSSLMESIIPPHPSDVLVLIFAFLAGQGQYNPLVLYLIVVSGSITGMMLLYTFGKWQGEKVVQILSSSFLGKIFPLRIIERAKKKLVNKGKLISVLNRFLPGMRAPLCLAAGIAHIDKKTFFIYSLLSVILWNFFLVIFGFYVGTTWKEASNFLKNYNIIVGLGIILFLVVLAYLYYRKRRNLASE